MTDSVAAPREWTWWSRLGLAWLIVVFVPGFLIRSTLLGALAIISFGLIQLPFAVMLLANRNWFADRIAEYFRHRPLFLGGTRMNQSAGLWRFQGAALLVLGTAFAVIGVWVATR